MEKDIGKITKNDTTEILVRIDDFGGRRGLTIREFVTSDRYTGFTKAGVRIQSADFPKLKEMINSISEEDMTMPEEPAPEGVPSDEGKVAPAPKKGQATLTKPGDKENLPDY